MDMSLREMESILQWVTVLTQKDQQIETEFIQFITILPGFSGFPFPSFSGMRAINALRGQDHLAIRQRAEKMKAMKADRP